MWEQIRANRRRSAFLVFIMFVLLVALGVVIAEAFAPKSGIIGALVAVALWFILSLVAYYQGDSILLTVSGAREIQHADHPMLFNIVEEMQIASGLPTPPRVYIMDDMALNAFATGRDPNNAAVAVTAGLLGSLNRDQLQGVIAHEMSHVVNRDVLFMTMVGVMLGAIIMISDLFLRSMRFGSPRYRGSSRAGGGQAQAVMFLVALLLAILAPIIAQIIYFAISRRREYLADANAAVLTRYPEGLASALEALAADTNPLLNANKATAPMYITNPFDKPGRWAVGLTSTHPPIEERIAILRKMAGGISFVNYDAAFRTVRGKRQGVMPSSALAASQSVAVRPPSADAGPIAAEGTLPPVGVPTQDPRVRMRQAGDLLRKMNQFIFLPCACGLRIKLPPDYKKDTVACPRCGRENAVPVAQMVGMSQVADTLTGMTQTGGAAPMVAPLVVPLAEVRKKAGSVLLEKPTTGEPPLAVTRTPGQWSSFRCACGAAVSVSPAHEADQIKCHACGRMIQLLDQ